VAERPFDQFTPPEAFDFLEIPSDEKLVVLERESVDLSL
jgi:hypothetical protein